MAILNTLYAGQGLSTSGGTISGDLTIDGDLTVSGGGGFAYSEVLTGDMKITNTAATISLEISHAHATTSALSIDAETTTGSSLYVDSGALTSGNIAKFHSNTSDATTRNLVSIVNEHESAAGARTLALDQDGDANSILIDSEATTDDVFLIENPTSTSGDIILISGADALTTGAAISIDSGGTALASTATGGLVEILHTGDSDNNVNNLLYIINDDAGSTGTTGLYIQQDSTGPALVLNAAVGDRSAAPTLAFGDGDTGFYESADDQLDLAHQGSAKFRFWKTYITSMATGGVRIMQAAATSTTPAYVFSNDEDTGIGRGAADTLNLITDGASRLVVDVNSRISLSNNDGGGDGNTIFGKSAGNAIESGGNYNICIGEEAGHDITTADNSVVVGYQANDKASGNGSNVAIGYQANRGYGFNNTVVGTSAANYSASGADSMTVIGHGAVQGNTTSGADYTVAVGASALTALTSGTGNVAVGYNALLTEDTGAKNTAIGYQSMKVLDFNGDGYNTAIGYNTMLAATGAIENVAIGGNAAIALITGDKNVIIGTGAGSGTEDVNKTVIIGTSACQGVMTSDADGTVAIGQSALAVLTTGARNVALGYRAGTAITESTDNIAIGYDALLTSSDTSAHQNIAIGSYALELLNSAGARNIAIGYEALETANHDDVDGNIAIGYRVMDGTGSAAISSCVGIGDSALGAVNNTAVTGTIAIGQSALGALTSGASNLAIGYLAADAITSGGYSICIGESAGGALTGSNSNSNIAIGYQALTAATTNAEKNVAIGNQAMYGAWSTAAVDECVSVGYGSMKGVLTADATGTVAIGASALAALTSGARNTAVGYNALAANLTGVNNTVLGYGAMDGANGSEGNMIAIGKDALGNMDNNSSSQNIAIGVGAMDGVGGVVATNNIMIGLDAGGGTWTGSASDANVGIGNLVMDAAMDGALNNTAVGHNALTALTSGDGNTSMGYNSGDTITTGGYNTIIGNNADSGAAGASNRTAIGHEAVGQADNSVTLGNANVTAVYMAMNVGARFTIGTGGAVTMPNQPAFLVHPASTQSNITTGSEVTIVFGTEIFDQGGDFASNTFTAPVTGRYQFSFQLYLEGVDSAGDYVACTLKTHNRNYTVIFDPDFGQDPVYWTATGSILADMDASDTAYLTIRQDSGTAQMDVTTNSYFSGFLAC